MKKIGMLVAVEIDAVLKKYGEPVAKETKAGCDILTYQMNGYTLFVLHSGAGEIAATIGTQILISVYGAEMILNFGIVGGLTDEMTLTRLCVVERVVHYDFNAGEYFGLGVGGYLEYPDGFIPTTPELVEKIISLNPEIKRVTCASADKFVSSPEKKAALHVAHEADICEMEAAGVVITCHRNHVPCLLIKAVSDSLMGGNEEFQVACERVADICFAAVDRLIQNL